MKQRHNMKKDDNNKVVYPSQTPEARRAYQRKWYMKHKKGKFQCKQCGEKFSTTSRLAVHTRYSHPKVKQPSTIIEPPLNKDNMTVCICPRCKCRFATLIID